MACPEDACNSSPGSPLAADARDSYRWTLMPMLCVLISTLVVPWLCPNAITADNGHGWPAHSDNHATGDTGARAKAQRAGPLAGEQLIKH